MTPRQGLLVLAMPAAVALAWLLPLGRIGTGALLGAVAFAVLVAARANLTVAFGALGAAAAVLFGCMTAVLAELGGLTVGRLLDTRFDDHIVANTLAVATVAFAVLGALGIAWGRLTRRFGDE